MFVRPNRPESVYPSIRPSANTMKTHTQIQFPAASRRRQPDGSRERIITQDGVAFPRAPICTHTHTHKQAHTHTHSHKPATSATNSVLWNKLTARQLWVLTNKQLEDTSVLSAPSRPWRHDLCPSGGGNKTKPEKKNKEESK